ncbi:hypothetical protein IAT40_000038 [Kwoniella sp. CBS 6097]
MQKLQLALEEARASYSAKNPNSLKAFHEASESLPGGGTRSSIFIHPFPLFIDHGEGVEIEDLDGHVYKDFVTDFTSGIYGKTDRILKKAIIDALENGLQLGAHTIAESRLAAHLCSRFPSIDLVRFANSGTEANILAISAALHYTQRNKVVVFTGGYHGSVLSHFGEHEGGDLKVPYDFLVCPYNDLSATQALTEPYKAEIGCIIVEPMIGAGGCIPGDPDFLRGLRTISKEIGAVLIFDEVQTARLGTGGRQKILDITPDMTTLGKFFGGGFAFGAFGGKKEIMSMEHLPLRMTGLGSINQFHSRLPETSAKSPAQSSSDSKTILDLLFFHLLEKGYWIAQRGLISLSFAMSEDDVRGFQEAVVDSARAIKGVLEV